MKLKAIALILLAAVLFSGCVEQPANGTGPEPGIGTPAEAGTGTFVLLVSDAPASISDFASLTVSFSAARIFPADENTGFVEEPLEGEEVDLTTVAGEKAVPLVEIALEEGTYTKVELEVESVEALLADGNSAEVLVPGNRLRIVRPFTIDANSETKFVFDISVVQRGRSLKYNLLPVIAKSGVIGKDVALVQEVERNRERTQSEERGT